eukprot:361894-Chlamydomonas_euryale.AAC.13
METVASRLSGAHIQGDLRRAPRGGGQEAARYAVPENGEGNTALLPRTVLLCQLLPAAALHGRRRHHDWLQVYAVPEERRHRHQPQGAGVQGGLCAGEWAAGPRCTAKPPVANARRQ